jgi:hypothetical protein
MVRNVLPDRTQIFNTIHDYGVGPSWLFEIGEQPGFAIRKEIHLEFSILNDAVTGVVGVRDPEGSIDTDDTENADTV